MSPTDPSDIRFVAEAFKWREVKSTNPVLLSFKRDDARIDVYFTTGTVVTSLKHPVRGRTQLVRRDIEMTLLVKLFDRPRTHTGKGYFRCAELRQRECAADFSSL